ncbi:MAG: hypothetical protein ACI855_005050, partial [Myxococcota bacterium]
RWALANSCTFVRNAARDVTRAIGRHVDGLYKRLVEPPLGGVA